MQRPPQTLDHHLRGQAGPLRDLIARAERLARVNRALRGWRSEPWLEGVRLANLRDSVAVLFADTAATSLLLRYRQAELLAFLRQESGLPLTRLDVKVKPFCYPN